MNIALIENLVVNNGYEIDRFDSDISKRRGYVTTSRYSRYDPPYEESEDEEQRERPRYRTVRRIYITLKKGNEFITFEEEYPSAFDHGSDTRAIGDIITKYASGMSKDKE